MVTAAEPRLAQAPIAHDNQLWSLTHGAAGGVFDDLVTGGEALHANMGRFGARPIRIAWLAIALRARVLAHGRGVRSGRAARPRRRLALSLLVLLSGCAGANLTPMVQVPLLRRAGQIEGGVSMRPSSPRAEIAGVIRAAATDHLRVGGSVGGATRRQRSSDFVGAEREPHRALQAEGFFGAEWGGLLLRFGALLGSGYATSERVSDVCIASPGVPGCTSRQRRVLATRYVRSYGQLHFGLAPPGPLATALALRIPFVVDLSEVGSAREADVSPEVALTQSLILRHVRLDLQPVWSRAQGFTFHLALLFRLDAGRER